MSVRDNRHGNSPHRTATLPKRAVRVTSDVVHARTEHKRIIRRLAILFISWAVATLLCGLLMYVFERHAKGSNIDSFGVSLFWSASQLITISSSLANPVTPPGRILAVAMDVYGFLIIATVIGSLGSIFVHEINMRLKAADASGQNRQENVDHL